MSQACSERGSYAKNNVELERNIKVMAPKKIFHLNLITLKNANSRPPTYSYRIKMCYGSLFKHYSTFYDYNDDGVRIIIAKMSGLTRGA